MRIVMFGLVLGCLWGCNDFQGALDTDRKPATPPGIAPVENAAEDPAGAPPAAKADREAAAPNVGRPNRGQGKSSIIGRKTREILNAKEELKKPNVRVIQPDVHGNDPLTQYRTAYLKAASFTGTLPVKQWISHHKALEDRYPTYEELIAWMDKTPALQLPVLTGGRKYGYDEDSGEIVVLEYQDRGTLRDEE